MRCDMGCHSLNSKKKRSGQGHLKETFGKSQIDLPGFGKRKQNRSEEQRQQQGEIAHGLPLRKGCNVLTLCAQVKPPVHGPSSALRNFKETSSPNCPGT